MQWWSTNIYELNAASNIIQSRFCAPTDVSGLQGRSLPTDKPFASALPARPPPAAVPHHRLYLFLISVRQRQMKRWDRIIPLNKERMKNLEITLKRWIKLLHSNMQKEALFISRQWAWGIIKRNSLELLREEMKISSFTAEAQEGTACQQLTKPVTQPRTEPRFLGGSPASWTHPSYQRDAGRNALAVQIPTRKLNLPN